jgi:hypothetical protein
MKHVKPFDSLTQAELETLSVDELSASIAMSQAPIFIGERGFDLELEQAMDRCEPLWGWPSEDEEPTV